ncbi:sulfate/molybdate ABC transporter ATP-binding protein [Raineyella fluvialis]|uniref:ATP-binding cassette domain-containing protein n=1 Tax=Raineyella fluvialis TaxID=2662261 RepID=A0A5Q2FD07_9ACTN|nr:ATP-binding cassette domain-containing protein [Raineyella fluvialis]QGF23657.1 ATP-binding cassette domain-containing protein [Raineyella fluvialis]
MADVRLDLRLAARQLDVALDVPDGQVVAVLGPNGAGKSTLLGLLAGTLTPTAGRVMVGGRDVTRLPPHRRRVALLAQQPLLFPHLSVLENVAFAPRAAGATRTEARRLARERLEAVGAAELADRRPGQLSGGQAQRVAIARALAADPEVLLLDEPFAALDVAVAPQLRGLLREVLEGRTALVVTHDLVDVVTLAGRAVVLDAGRVVEDRSVRALVESPHSRFAADLAGRVLLEGTLAGELPPGLPVEGTVRSGDAVLVRTSLGPVAGLWEDDTAAGPGVRALALVDPAAVSLHREVPHGSPRNCWPVEVEGMEPRGGQLRVVARALTERVTSPEPHDGGIRGPVDAPEGGQGVRLAADITPAAAAELAVAPGRRLWFVVKAQQVRVYRGH